jgi:parvulin-like peptidyl-prolyl isomerase
MTTMASLVLAIAGAQAPPLHALSPAALDAVYRLAQSQQRHIERQALDFEAREQAVLARIALQAHTDAELFPDASVGFAVDVAIEDRLVANLRALYRERLEADIRTLPGATIDALVIDRPELDQASLETCLGNEGRMRLEYQMSPAQRERAEDLVVLRFRLAANGAEQTLSLGELYRRQNVQGRIALHGYDRDHLRAQAMQYLASRIVLDRVTLWEGANFVAQLRAWVGDRERVGALARWYGVGADSHDVVAHLKELAAAVTAEDIRGYYKTHREEFRRIDRVQALHIRVADEAAARVAYLELKEDGSNFSDVAKRRSVAPDAINGGDLGWLGAANHGWLGDVAFAQAAHTTGKPTREPVDDTTAAAWEIVRVETRKESFYAVESETVAWAARHALAQARAGAEFRALRATARKEIVARDPSMAKVTAKTDG